MPVNGEPHLTLPGYVWDSRFGTYIPQEFANMSAQQAAADAARQGQAADPRFGATAQTTQAPPAPPPPRTYPRGLEVVMPDGSVQRFNQITPALDQALLAGGRVRDPDDPSRLLEMSELGGTRGAGWLGDTNRPLNVLMGGDWERGQAEALMRAFGWSEDAIGRAIDPETGLQRPGAAGAGGETGNLEAAEHLPLFETPEIPGITLPDTPQVNRTFGADFDNQYAGNLDAQARNIGNFYDFNLPTMQAAQHNMGNIPRVEAELPDSFAALDFLLSGKGFDDATMAKMRASATDDIGAQGRAQRGNARLMAEQSGLAGSPAAMALEAQASRRQGDAQTRALNDLDVMNAQQGMQNRVTGAGMELNRQMSASQQANLVALQNAANIIQAMNQNVANLQQSNMVNTQNRVGQQMERAGQQAGTYNQGAQAYNQSSLNRANEADFFNTGNRINRSNNQANLDRDRDRFNASNRMTRYGWDTSNIVNLANQTGANNLYALGNEAMNGLNFQSPMGNLFRLTNPQGGA